MLFRSRSARAALALTLYSDQVIGSDEATHQEAVNE
jgi:hypothetical protein